MFFRKFTAWLPLALAITILSGLIYLTVQQSLRLSANDPQIQISEDAAAKLANGQSLQTVVPLNMVDISQSLATFMIAYDQSGQILASSATLNGKTPVLPNGVLDYVKEHGQDRLTWQPDDNVRLAAVVAPFNGSTSGYVLVARSIREVEKRELLLEFQVGIGWIVTIFLTLMAVMLAKDHKRTK